MWEMYDELIETIAREATVDFLVCGTSSMLVRSGEAYGIGSVTDDTFRSEILPRRSLGMPLRDLAACIKSWNLYEAGLGLAAINAYYNDPERLRSLGLSISASLNAEDRTSDPFITYQNDVRDKNVVIIGRFPYIERLFAPICDLSVIERFYPNDGDYPEQAADYLLAECDYAFISSYTIAEKSLPRYLKAASHACTTVVGPATPMTPLLFKYGADDLSGFVIKYGAGAERAAMGFGGNLHGAGQKLSLKRAQ